MEPTEIFKPNNHSKYEINWKTVDIQTDSKLKRVVNNLYGLKPALPIMQVDEWEKMSNNFKITVEQNGQPKTLLLRKNIVINSEQDLVLMDRVASCLRDNGIPTPKTIKDKVGRVTAFSEGNFYQMYEFIDGNHFCGRIDELRDFAKNLARIHKILEKIPLVEEVRKKPVILVSWNLDLFIHSGDRAKNENNEMSHVIAENSEFIIRCARLVSGCSDKIKKSRKQVIKGDLHPLNTIYADGKLKAILDFADIEWSELLNDVGNACHRFVRQYIVYYNKPWQSALPIGLSTFLGEYETLNPLSSLEKEMVPVFMIDNILKKIYYRINGFYNTDQKARLDDPVELKKLITLLQEAFTIYETRRA